MITTIQIRENVKNQLQSLKSSNQTFEDVILYLLQEREKHKKMNIELIKAEAKVLRRINERTTKELEFVEDIGAEVIEW